MPIIVPQPEAFKTSVIIVGGAATAETENTAWIGIPTQINTAASQCEIKRFFDLIFWPLLRITFTSFINR